jgi:hypothetical protein
MSGFSLWCSQWSSRFLPRTVHVVLTLHWSLKAWSWWWLIGTWISISL